MTPEQKARYARMFPTETPIAQDPIATETPIAQDPIATAPPAPESEARYAAMFGDNPAPDLPAELPTPTPLQMAKHVGKGLVRGLADATIDLPGGIGQLDDALDLPERLRGWAAPAAKLATDAMGANQDVPGVPGMNSPLGLSLMALQKKPEEGAPRSTGVLPDIMKMTNLLPAELVDTLTGEEFPREAAPLVDSLRTMATWGAAAPVNMLRNISIKPDIYMGAGAAAGEYITDKMGGDSELGQLWGVPALVAGLWRGKAGTTPRETVKALKVIDDLSTTNKDWAGNVIPTIRTPPPAGADPWLSSVTPPPPNQILETARAKVAAGERGTLADLTQDQGIANIEEAVSRMTPRGRERQAAVIAERQRQIADELRIPFGTGNANLASEAAAADTARQLGVIDTEAARLAQEATDATTVRAANGRAVADSATARAQADAAELAAEQAAVLRNQARVPVATDKLPEQTSTELYGLVKAAENQLQATADDAWRAFDDSPPFNAKPVKASTDNVLDSLPPSDRAQFDKAYPNLLESLDFPGAVTPTSMTTMVAKLNAAIDSAVGANGAYKGTLVNLRNSVQDTIETINPVYSEARRLTRNVYERFKEGPLGIARKVADPKKGNAPERYTTALKPGDIPGVESARKLGDAGVLGTPKSMFEHLKTLAELSGGADRKFLTKYRGWIGSLEGADAKKFTNYVEADTAAKTATDTAATAEKTAEKAAAAADREVNALSSTLNARKTEVAAKAEKLKKAVTASWVAQYGSSPNTTLRQLTGNLDNAPQLKALYKNMETRGQGESFRRAVGDHVEQQLLKGDTVQNMTLTKTLQDAGVLTPAELSNLQRATNKMKSVDQRKQAVRVVLDAGGDEAANLVASGGAAALMQFIPSGNASLTLTNALRRYLRYGITKAKGHAEIAKIEEFMMNPNRYIKAVDSAANQSQAAKKVLSSIVGAGNAAAIIESVENEK